MVAEVYAEDLSHRGSDIHAAETAASKRRSCYLKHVSEYKRTFFLLLFLSPLSLASSFPVALALPLPSLFLYSTLCSLCVPLGDAAKGEDEAIIPKLDRKLGELGTLLMM